jgi:hypothetical protein
MCQHWIWLAGQALIQTYERRKNGTLERAFQDLDLLKTFTGLLPLSVIRFWEFLS